MAGKRLKSPILTTPPVARATFCSTIRRPSVAKVFKANRKPQNDAQRSDLHRVDGDITVGYVGQDSTLALVPKSLSTQLENLPFFEQLLAKGLIGHGLHGDRAIDGHACSRRGGMA